MAIINTNNPVSVLLLKGLVVTPLGVLTPAFTSNVFSYTAVEAYLSSSVTVSPTNWDTTASNRVIYLGATNGVISGVPSTSMALNANPNSNNVVVIQGHRAGWHLDYELHGDGDTSSGPDAGIAGPRSECQRPDDELAAVGERLSVAGADQQPGHRSLEQLGCPDGSTLTNTYTAGIDSNNPSVFYRLINTNSP